MLMPWPGWVRGLGVPLALGWHVPFSLGTQGTRGLSVLGIPAPMGALLSEQPLSPAHPRSLLPPPCWWELGFGDASKLPLPCVLW